MFWPDVVELKQFYASPLGQVALRMIRRAVVRLWPEAKGETILGLGYAAPYLMPFMHEALLPMAFMPAAQGAIYWPPAGANLTVLIDEAQIPLADNSVNRVILAHVLENSEQARGMLQEIWRVLTPGGRVLALVPNRRGIWARALKSPFAYGQPFSAPQLRELLLDHQLTPLRSNCALFAFPGEAPLLLGAAGVFETIGQLLFPAFGGVLLMEAEKQIYASTKEAVRVGKRLRPYVRQVQPAMTFR